MRTTSLYMGRLYCALFWIQGKTTAHVLHVLHDCTVPYFGFKAKRPYTDFRAGADCTVPYFGFKAKLEIEWRCKPLYCTVPYFGFKAKLPEDEMVHFCHCTVPYFGFKAKPAHRHSGL